MPHPAGVRKLLGETVLSKLLRAMLHPTRFCTPPPRPYEDKDRMGIEDDRSIVSFYPVSIGIPCFGAIALANERLDIVVLSSRSKPDAAVLRSSGAAGVM